MDKTKLWYINTNKIFSGLSVKDKGEIASKLTELNVKKRGFVYNSGDRAETVYILKEGRIKITRFSEEGRELTVDILEPGDVLGELSLAGERERETDAVAMEDSFLCVIKRKDFEDFIGKMPGLSFTITKWMGLRLRRIENRFENMIFKDVRTRLVAVFRDLAQQHGVPADNGTKIAIRLSHKDIAGLVGATRETVTLELNNLKRSGVILIDGKYFILSAKHPS
ncbi:MAG: Crp/Fnr family transcriptional regulator [Deltaproteobacteria bacterium]|nr:Crp/Fnr family transcriptional regulator [Deltaproteobacteria bacterium]